MVCRPRVAIAEADRLFQLCLNQGIEVSFQNENDDNPYIQLTYSPFETFATISLFNVRL